MLTRMEMNSRVTARIDSDTRDRVNAVCDKYQLTESQVVRLCLHGGLDVIEREGLDNLVEKEALPFNL